MACGSLRGAISRARILGELLPSVEIQCRETDLHIAPSLHHGPP